MNSPDKDDLSLPDLPSNPGSQRSSGGHLSFLDTVGREVRFGFTPWSGRESVCKLQAVIKFGQTAPYFFIRFKGITAGPASRIGWEIYCLQLCTNAHKIIKSDRVD